MIRRRNIMSSFSMNHSAIKFKLKEIMEHGNISKNKLCRLTGFRFETIQGYYKGNISRIDLFVLSEFCRVLNCRVEDILEYCPEKEKEVVTSS
mgnify:CR=1 FL=1